MGYSVGEQRVNMKNKQGMVNRKFNLELKTYAANSHAYHFCISAQDNSLKLFTPPLFRSFTNSDQNCFLILERAILDRSM